MAVVVSPLTKEALGILAVGIRAARLRRGWTVRELAERVGVSQPTIIKVERGDPTVAIGTMLEAAVLVGVPLFAVDAEARERYGAHKRAELALLPAAARPRRRVDDDF
ncbi:MAG: helix-turn-helix transcriptional regulator [Acidimicrobiia bacterium]